MRLCKVFGPNRTKSFHVKHFGTILRWNRTILMFGSFTSRLVRARAFVDADLDRIIILGVVLDEWHMERLGDDGEIRLGLTGWHCHRGMIKLLVIGSLLCAPRTAIRTGTLKLPGLPAGPSSTLPATPILIAS
jgi:hypothetical protein